MEAQPKICPECKGTGGVYSKDSSLCEGCTVDENCRGAWYKPNCSCLYHRCHRCKGTGMLNVPNAPVVYRSPYPKD